MAHIVSILCDTLVTELVTYCQTNVSEDDPTRAVLVRGGRLQEDPTKNVVQALVHGNDPEAPEKWEHTIITQDLTKFLTGGMAQVMGMYEVGGGEQWWRRFTVELQMFWKAKKLNRNQARDAAHLVLGRAEAAIKQSTSALAAQADEFGEQAWGVYVRRSRCLERGGPPKDWIWNARIWIEIGTSKP